ncbi:MAG: glycosyltransferase [Thermoanaerobaculia bacterium]
MIPLPVDLDRFARRRAKDDDLRTLLYVGRVHPEKGLELLVRAFAGISDRFPGWRLEIVGPAAESEGGGGERYLGRCAGLARGRRVGLRGPVFDAGELVAVYHGADLFCYPSLAEQGEAFGVAALESDGGRCRAGGLRPRLFPRLRTRRRERLGVRPSRRGPRGCAWACS